MPYFEDGDLESVKWRLTTAASISIMRNIWSAIDYLNSVGMMHRDLKPANILVKHNRVGSHGGDRKPLYKAVVADFGTLIHADTANTACVTYIWAAPEIYNKMEPYDHSVDRYSMGVILFWLLNGSPPNVRYVSEEMWNKCLGSRIWALINRTDKEEEENALMGAVQMASYLPADRPSMQECREILWQGVEPEVSITDNPQSGTEEAPGPPDVVQRETTRTTNTDSKHVLAVPKGQPVAPTTATTNPCRVMKRRAKGRLGQHATTLHHLVFKGRGASSMPNSEPEG